MPKPDPDPVSDQPIWVRLGDMWHGLEGWLQGIILLGLCVGTIYAFLKWLKPRLHEVRSDARAIRDTLVGRPAVRDSITNRVVSPALPSIGDRMASQEEAVQKVADAVQQLATTATRLDQHDKRLNRLEDALQIDRRLDKIESVQLLRTIETVAQAEATDPAEGDRPD